VTSDPDFKVTTFFEVEYRKNLNCLKDSYYCTTGKYTYHMECYYVWFGDLD